MSAKKLSDLNLVATAPVTKKRKKLSDLGFIVKRAELTPVYWSPDTQVATAVKTTPNYNVSMGKVTNIPQMAGTPTNPKKLSSLKTPRMDEMAVAGANANPLETAHQAELRAKSEAIPKPVYNKVTHIADTHTTLGEVVRSAVKGLDVARLGLIETGRENMAALDIRSVAEFWRTHQNGGTFNEGKTWRTYTPEQAKIEYEKAMKDAEIADRVAVNAQSNLETVIKNNPDRYLPEFTGDATHDQTLQFSYELGQNATSQVISMGLSAATGGLAAPLIAPLFGLWSAQSKYAQSIGAGKDVTKAYRSAVISGIVNWVGEYAQLSMFGSGKGPGNLVSGQDALQKSMNTIANDVSTRTFAQLKSRLASVVRASGVVENAISGLGAKYGAKAIAGDVFENAFQEFLESAGESIGDWVTGIEKYDESSLKEAWKTACKSAIMGGLLAGATTIVSNGISYSIDKGNLSRAQQVAKNIENTLNQEVDYVDSEIQKVDGSLSTTDLARLQTLRNWVAKNHTISENKNALNGERFEGMSLVSVLNGKDIIRDGAVTAHVAKLVGQTPVDGTYVMETGDLAGVTVHEKSFILPKDLALKIASITNQESIAVREDGVWKFINVETGEQMGDSYNGIDFHPAPGVPQTKVQTKNRGYFSFTFTNIQPTDKNKEAIQQKVEAENPLVSYTMTVPEQYTGTTSQGVENAEQIGLAGGTLKNKFANGTSSTSVVTPTGVLNYRPYNVDIKGKSLTVIQSWDGETAGGEDANAQIDKALSDIEAGNASYTGMLLDSQHLSGPAFTDLAFPGVMASATDLSTRLKSGKTVVILLSSLQGAKGPKISGESGRWLFTSMRNNAIFKGVVRILQPEIINNSETAVNEWNAQHPDKQSKSLLDLQLLSDAEKIKLNDIAKAISDEYNIKRGGRIYGVYILKNVTPEEKYAVSSEGENVFKAYDKIYTGLYVKFDNVDDMPVLQDVLTNIQAQVKVPPGKKQPGVGGFYQPKTAQSKQYTPTAPMMVDLIGTIKEALTQAKSGGIQEVAPLNALAPENIERMAPLSKDSLALINEAYNSLREVASASKVSNYTVQFGNQNYNSTTSGNVPVSPIVEAFQEQQQQAPVTPGVTGNGFSIVDKKENKIVSPIVAFLDIKKKPLDIQSNLDRARESYTDDCEALRSDGIDDGTYKQITMIRSTPTQVVKSANEGLVLMPDGKGQLYLKDVKLPSFADLGERLKAAGKKWKDLNDFSIIYAALKGHPVNKESMEEVNLVYQKDMQKVQENAQALMSQYSPEDVALYKGIMDDAHKYILPMAQYMAARGMIDTGDLSVEEFVDRYVSAAPRPEKFKFSSPLDIRDVQNVSHDNVVDFLDGIGNAMNHYARFIEYNEYVKNFAEKHGYVSNSGEVSFFDDDGTIKYVDAPDHIVRQLKNIIDYTNPTWKWLNNEWYKKAMALSRFTKIATPAFAQLNLIRDGELVLLRYGVHPATMIQTILKQFGFKAEKASGIMGMGTPGDSAFAKTRATKMLQYTKDNILGISESLMRNYAYNVEANKGNSDVDQMYALVAGSTDFTVHGSSPKAANLGHAWQFAQASLNVAQSWDLGIKEVIRDMDSTDNKIRVEAFTKAATMLAVAAAAVVYKEREKEKKELADYVIDAKIPIRIGKKILAVPEGFSTGTMIENSIASVIAGIKMGQSIGEITSELALDVYGGILGYIGRDSDPSVKTMVATLSPTLFEPIARSLLNVQYGGREIDPYTYGAKWTHYFKSTSQVARNTAVLFHDKFGIDVSPIGLEFLFKSYLGRYGTYITKMDDTGVNGFVSDYFAQQFTVPVPEGIKTQAYSEWNSGYSKVKDDLAQARKGNYMVSQNMARDLLELESISKLLPQQTTAQGVYALSIYGLSVLESYKQHKAQAK